MEHAPATQTATAVRRAADRPHGVAWLLRAAGLLLAGYVALLVLLQTGWLWQLYSPLQDRLPAVFGLLNALFGYSAQKSDADLLTGRVGIVLYLLVLAWLFVAFAVVLGRLRRVRWSKRRAGWALRVVAASTAAMLVLLFFAREMFAVDAFAYSFFGKIWVVYGANPYIHVPSEFAAQDTGNWIQYLYWRDLPCPYGPLWLLLAGGVARVAEWLGGDIAFYVAGHKLLASAAHLLNVWLVWLASGALWRSYGSAARVQHAAIGTPRWKRWIAAFGQGGYGPQVLATVAYAWNPLMLIEFGISGHNDVLMLTPVLLAVLAHLRGRWQLAALCLALACLVKFTAVIFLPGYLWLLFWQGRRGGWTVRGIAERLARPLAATAIFAATFAIFYLPFWQGPSTLNVLYNDPTATYFIHSLSTISNRFLPGLLAMLPGDSAGDVASKLSRWVPLLITAVVAVWQTWGARSPRRMVVAWGWVVFVFLAVGLSWFWPWYVAWLIVPAALSGRRLLLNATVLLSLTSLTVYIIGSPLRSLWPDARLWAGLWVMGLPLLYVGASLWLGRTRRVPAPLHSKVAVEAPAAESA